MAKQQTITFRNVHLRYYDGRRKDESAPFVRLHLTADYSKPVAEAMGWPETIGDGVTDGSLSGRMAAVALILTPNDKMLKSRELQIECSEVSDFRFVAEKDEDTGRVVSAELRFIARSNQKGAAALLEDYWHAVGAEDAQMKLSYTKAAVQGTLDIPADEDAQDEFANADQPGSPALAEKLEVSRRKSKVN